MCNISISAQDAGKQSGNLTDLEKIALAGAIKDKELDSIKDKIKDGSTGEVDFTVRIKASIQKGFCSAATSASFASTAAICSLLKALGIGEKKLRNALENLPENLEEDKKLAAVLADASRSRASKYPKSKRGSIASQVTITRIGVTSYDPTQAPK